MWMWKCDAVVLSPRQRKRVKWRKRNVANRLIKVLRLPLPKSNKQPPKLKTIKMLTKRGTCERLCVCVDGVCIRAWPMNVRHSLLHWLPDNPIRMTDSVQFFFFFCYRKIVRIWSNGETWCMHVGVNWIVVGFHAPNIVSITRTPLLTYKRYTKTAREKYFFFLFNFFFLSKLWRRECNDHIQYSQRSMPFE